MLAGLMIKKDGILINTKWNSDKREYESFDVSDMAPRFLFDSCILDEGVTLRDIFLLINKNVDVFDAVFGNWCKEIVTEGLQSTDNVSNLKYLELYWDIYTTNGCGDNPPVIGGLSFPSFHGIGENEDENFGVKGELISYGISFSSGSSLAHLPVKLKDSLTIYNQDDFKEEKAFNKVPEYTLGHILYGIIWELSFHGSPVMREEFRNKMDDSLQDFLEKLDKEEE